MSEKSISYETVHSDGYGCGRELPTESDRMLEASHGEVPYGLLNDYMFRAVLQNSNEALRHLLSALLGIPFDSITDCRILNPIILGNSIQDKSSVMDVKVEINHKKLINLEMQVGNLKHWPKRALFYLSRLYSNGNIKRGQDYGKLKPALHIGILTKSPFKDIQEFYSEYYMMNPANGHIFSRIYSARVLDLSQIDNVSEGQKQTELYFWARLFLASTWEEINMLVKERKYLQSAASHLRWLSEEEEIQEQCAARERYYLDMNSSKADGIEIGLRKGRKQGRKQGIRKGINRINILNQRLIEDNRIEDLRHAAADPKYQKALLQEYRIIEDEKNV